MPVLRCKDTGDMGVAGLALTGSGCIVCMGGLPPLTRLIVESNDVGACPEG